MYEDLGFGVVVVEWDVGEADKDTVTLLLRPRGENIGGALINCESALFNLRKSNGYRVAKRDNPHVFANTFSGRCEADIIAAIQLLGGTP